MTKYKFLPSGIWIDMNENSNFNPGEQNPATHKSYSEIDLDDLPFNPLGQSKNLET